MRNFVNFAIAAAAIFAAVGAFAMTTKHVDHTGDTLISAAVAQSGILPMQMMTSAKNLPSEQYDAF